MSSTRYRACKSLKSYGTKFVFLEIRKIKILGFKNIPNFFQVVRIPYSILGFQKYFQVIRILYTLSNRD
jgi:hypothetical protein